MSFSGTLAPPSAQYRKWRAFGHRRSLQNVTKPLILGGMRMIRIRTAFLGIATAGVLAWPGAAETLRVGEGTEHTSIDPHYWSGFPNVQLGLTIFGHLVNYDSSFRL